MKAQTHDLVVIVTDVRVGFSDVHQVQAGIRVCTNIGLFRLVSQVSLDDVWSFRLPFLVNIIEANISLKSVVGCGMASSIQYILISLTGEQLCQIHLKRPETVLLCSTL